MQSSKQSDSERDFERDSAGNAKALSNPTTLARAAAPSANAGAAFAGVAEHEKACSSGDFERQERLRGTPEQRFRAAGGCGARPSSDFERKARPVWRLRVLPGPNKHARAEISNAKWLRGTLEQRFRAASGYGARPSSDFERKARPVQCFRVLPAWLGTLSAANSSGGFTI